mmetsp:Transcript_29496/g.28230  ORF Transcript_29496/g.28230 Transcript_29496/m.28230 type:complete len:82 (+) Transcript_29496:282-527(+)
MRLLNFELLYFTWALYSGGVCSMACCVVRKSSSLIAVLPYALICSSLCRGGRRMCDGIENGNVEGQVSFHYRGQAHIMIHK